MDSDADQQPPDPRFLLANERTYLAWMRTTLALLAAAAAILAVDLGLSGPMENVLAVFVSLIALITCVQGWRSWRLRDRALHRHQPLPPTAGTSWVAIGLVVTTVILIIAVVV